MLSEQDHAEVGRSIRFAVIEPQGSQLLPDRAVILFDHFRLDGPWKVLSPENLQIHILDSRGKARLFLEAASVSLTFFLQQVDIFIRGQRFASSDPHPDLPLVTDRRICGWENRKDDDIAFGEMKMLQRHCRRR
ncbi:MAG: hypothetical protein IKO93_13345, partial [Lentisphaeria bacterium]|nr:hypothetical protein [Lentisphaeria bacterium]